MFERPDNYLTLFKENFLLKSFKMSRIKKYYLKWNQNAVTNIKFIEIIFTNPGTIVNTFSIGIFWAMG